MKLIDTDILIDHFHSNEAVYLRAFRRSHHIDLGDALIAATALLHGAELFTRNVKHYPMTDIVVTVPYKRGH